MMQVQAIMRDTAGNISPVSWRITESWVIVVIVVVGVGRIALKAHRPR
jgi:hypothetical protein